MFINILFKDEEVIDVIILVSCDWFNGYVRLCFFYINILFLFFKKLIVFMCGFVCYYIFRGRKLYVIFFYLINVFGYIV